MKTMTAEEAMVAEKVLKALVHRDAYEDDEVEVDFCGARSPGLLRSTGTCSAHVAAARDSDFSRTREAEDLVGSYEVTVHVRRVR